MLRFYRQVGRGDHGLVRDPGHMDIVTDPRSSPLWQSLADWLLDHLDDAPTD